MRGYNANLCVCVCVCVCGCVGVWVWVCGCVYCHSLRISCEGVRKGGERRGDDVVEKGMLCRGGGSVS